ncbi:MAG: lipopolysaccharide biosynthesis protein [Proteobacteria bacterium]|nr:lipopolysaccharide biosynthesis protein [Pseudomonadota bacterium]
MRSSSAAGQGDWAARPRYALSDLPTLLWRERMLMLAVFLVIFFVGAAFALTLKRAYPAHSSVLVRLGQEYVYEPRVGDAARGAVPETGQVLQSETEILGSDGLKEQVVLALIKRFGWAELDPKHPKAYDNISEAKRQTLRSQAVLAMGRSLKIETGTDTPVIRLTYTDTDKDRAALVLNTLLEQYLIYRRSVLLDPMGAALEDQRRSFQDRLDRADAAYQTFLTSNSIGDFDAEKTSLSQLQSQIEQQQYATETQLKERSGRLAGLNTELARVTPEVGLYRDSDNTAANKLLDLKLQREALLSKYRPDAQPVKDMDAQIAQLQAAVSSGRAQGQGVARTGVNPVYQTLQTEKLQLAAEVNALQQSLATLQQQSEQLTQRRLRLADLEPQFQSLSRDRDVLQSNVKDFQIKEQQSQAARAIASNTNDNIRIIERATPPVQGKSLRMPVIALSLMFAGFSALCAGLLRMFLRPGLPTPASASRTLDLPVLGTAPVKAA